MTEQLHQVTLADTDHASTGLVVVDHGSRRAESNRLHEQFVARFGDHCDFRIVEPAHMELSEPSIQTAFDRCVARGAQRVVVVPYFLWPGKHWDQDIPNLTREAAAKHPGVPYLVAAPIGMHPLMVQVIASRVDQCLQHVAGRAPECAMCQGTGRCVMREHAQA
jgi:sirohydrochlorin ferrochelatase